MASSLTVRFWGVRGSIATSGPAFVGVGGNTTCVEVRAGNEIIILDAGTGLFPLAQSLGETVNATFLMTHFHWDHIQGFPHFRPAYVPGNTLTFYGPGESGHEIEAVFAQQMRPPTFPVALAALSAQLEFHAVPPGNELQIGPARIRTAALHHPQPCLGYRISVGGSSVVFATDTEPRDPGSIDPAVLDLAQDTDLLIHDARYTEHEYHGRGCPARKGWGHSTYDVACRMARCAGVKQLALFHHDPSHDDSVIERMLAEARALFPNTKVAREGMTIHLRGTASGHPEVTETPARSRRAA